MSTDETKKKINSLRESISKLETERTLSAGNKRAVDAIQRVIDRFEKEIKKLKAF